MIRSIVALAACCAPMLASAAVHCVHNATELRTALSTAKNNGQPDEIRIRTGNFYATASQPFDVSISEPYGLSISGGWNGASSQCLVPSYNSSDTKLDALGTTTALRIYVSPAAGPINVVVEGLTFRNGKSTTIYSDRAAALVVHGASGSSHNVLVDRVIAEYNDSIGVAPTVYLSSDDGFVRFSNSFVRWNDTESSGAVVTLSNGGGRALNNLTVLFNNRSSGNGSVEWWGYAPGLLANSLVWGNNSGVAELMALHFVQLSHVRYGSFYGDHNPQSLDNSAVAAPQLDALHRPLPGSPLRDVLTPGLGVGTRDVYGSARDLGGMVDIGAAEGI